MSRQRRFIPAFLLAGIVGLGACQGSGTSPSASGSADADGSASAVGSASASSAESASASAVASAATSEPIPSDSLGEFACDLPIVEDASVAIANITDVRVGSHDGYDRVVFEFAQGTPEMTLERDTPPFTQDASGAPIDVAGESFLRLTMRGGSKQTDEGTSSYDGPLDFEPDFPALVHLIEGGDFERQSTWYFGLAHESCVRVILLEDPARIAIDIEH
jgi:hypothetical protein